MERKIGSGAQMPRSSGKGDDADLQSLQRVLAVIKPFGFSARRVPRGFFLNQGGDDLTLVRNSGEIVPYAHDANAFLVASRVGAALKHLAEQSQVGS